MLYKIKQLIHESRHGIFLISFAVALLYLVSHLNSFFLGVQRFFALFKPLLIGFCIAYVLNIPMTKIEKYLEKYKEEMKFLSNKIRPIAITLTIVMAVVIILILFLIIVPQLIDSLIILLSNLGMYIENMIAYVVVLLDHLNIENSYINDSLANIQSLPWNDIFGNIINWIGEQSEAVTDIAGGLMDGTVSIATKVGVVVTAFMISLYLLGNKENYIRQLKQILLAFVGRDVTEILCEFGGKVNEIFRNFIGGQLLEAAILFGMYFISMTVLQMPYALLISALIAITSIIPYFGAMIGSIVGFILIFAINPIQAIGFYIFFQVLQQIENNLIYPRVVGNSVGLPAIWVVIGILAFGSMFGVFGMIVAVPTCAVLYQAFRTLVLALLRMREIKPMEEDE